MATIPVFLPSVNTPARTESLANNPGVVLRDDITRRIALGVEERGLSHRDVAQMLGVNDSTVSRWVHGQRTPSAEFIPGLCTLLGLTADALLGIEAGDGTAAPAPRRDAAAPPDEIADAGDAYALESQRAGVMGEIAKLRRDLRRIVREEVTRAVQFRSHEEGDAGH